MPGAVTSAGPSSNLRSKLHDKAKVIAAMIQELTEELQAIDQESLRDEQDSEVTQDSDLEQEDSETYLTNNEGQGLIPKLDLSSLCSQQEEPDVFLEKNTAISCQLENLKEDNVSHTEEVIIGSEQGTTFPTQIGTTMCNALIDTGAMRSCMSEEYY